MSNGRRGFVKVSMDVPVRYKFLSKTVEVKDQDVHEGHTNNLSGTGLILMTKIPDGYTLTGLLTGDIMVGVNIVLPSQDNAIKALANVVSIDAVSETPGKCGFVLRFMDMSKENSDELMRYTIRAQITKKVHRGPI